MQQVLELIGIENECLSCTPDRRLYIANGLDGYREEAVVMDLSRSHSDIFDPISIHTVGMVETGPDRATAFLTGQVEFRCLVYAGEG